VRRVLSAGIRKPLRTTAFEKSSVLTSGRTFRWTRSPVTIGVKFKRTPNSLYWTLMAIVLPEPCAIGIGISPPARKLASLPLSATRFGSARLWNMPFVCSALMTVPSWCFASKRNRLRKSLKTSFSLEGSELSNTGAACCSVVDRAMTFL